MSCVNSPAGSGRGDHATYSVSNLISALSFDTLIDDIGYHDILSSIFLSVLTQTETIAS